MNESYLQYRGAHLLFAVQHAMGHANLATTGIYVHLSTDTLRQEIDTHLG